MTATKKIYFYTLEIWVIMDNDLLTNFGMTPTEAKIYKEILLLKESKIGQIIERTTLHRGTVYNSLQKLCAKGFLSFIQKEGKGYYCLTDLNVFNEKIKQEKQRLDKLDKSLKEIKEIKGMREYLEKPNIKILIGDAGFKSFFKDLYDYSYLTKKEYLFMGQGGEMIRHFGKEYYVQTQELKKNMKVKCRVILNSTDPSKNDPTKKIVVGDVKYLSWKYLSETSTWIYGNKVVIVIWKTNPIKIVVIDSREVRDSYGSFFEEMWKSAKKQ